jgi:hypothetical protein
MNYHSKTTKKNFDKAIIALAKDIVLSAEFADINTEGHQSKGEIAQSMADMQTDLDNRRSLMVANPDYDLPPEERAIFENGKDALDTACEQWGVKNPLDDYEAND